MVLDVHALHVPRSLRKLLRRRPFRVTMDERFREVMEACGTASRPDQDGTWITRDMLEAYERLHRLGFAHSVEALTGDRLVGGLYGVSLGAMFFGESMFAQTDDASKVAFVVAVEQMARWGITHVDCQVHTPHLERFGAEEIPRARYLQLLAAALEKPTRRGKWSLSE
jgi:leucyl/phenylalanyl-tRNA--protein transferase